MNAFSWFVLACVAVCAVLAVRAMRRTQRRGGCGACAGGCAACPHACPGRVKKQNKRQKAAPCATAHGAAFYFKKGCRIYRRKQTPRDIPFAPPHPLHSAS